jgi:predicted nucleic acid-binding protein
VIVLDTTVLIYATGAEHRFREPCRRIVVAASRGELDASTTVEVLQEFVHVRGRRRSRAEAADRAAAYADLLAPPATPRAPGHDPQKDPRRQHRPSRP